MSPTTDDTINAFDFYRRALGKLTHKGVLCNLVKLQRLSDRTRDSFPMELQRVAKKYPQAEAIKFERQSWNWWQVNEEANRYAHALKEIGLRKGDVVAVDVTNRPRMLFTLMGILKLGAVAALQNTTLRGETLAHSLSVVKARALLFGEEQLEHLESLPEAPCAYAGVLLYLPDHAEARVPEGFTDLAAAAAAGKTDDLPETADITFGDECVYIYTSGTTGLPKAAVQPHRRLAMGGLFAGRVLRELTTGDTLYCPLPLYHSNALQGGWAACVYTGAAFVPARTFSASKFWDEIRDYNATGFIYIGEMLRYLLNQPPSPNDRQHRVKAIAGAGLRIEIWDTFKKRFGIDSVYEYYGASESPTGFMNVFNFDRTSGWLPRGWKTIRWDADAEAPVRRKNGLCEVVGKREVGLLLFKLDKHQKFDGYTDRDATEKKVLTDVLTKGDRWFDTGDLVLNQGLGHMRFVDRTGDTFRWNGENVATTQVESVINRSDQIAEAVVYGVEVPGNEGRCGMARLIVGEGENLDRDGFAAFLRKELPKYAMPRFLRLGSESEVTDTFKHRKGSLKEEGFDLDQIGEPVLLLAPTDSTWRPLTPELRKQILDGDIRL
jgi:acyl-CoA synthetase (AMP-forming)/AMP-acid ligase II